MKILFLGNSSEIYGDIPEAERRSSRVSQSLEAEFGEPVAVTVRRIWPTADLPALVRRWVDEGTPDIVYLNVISYWFNFRSVPLAFERRLGALGVPIRAVGVKASQVPWIGHTRAFHWTRRRLQRTIGGATHFTPEQVIAVMRECIQAIVRDEHIALVVKGPRSTGDYSPDRQWAEKRRQTVHRALQAQCRDLHVDYVGTETPRYLTNPSPDLLGDRIHSGSQNHARSAEEISAMLKAAWERHRSLGI